MSTQPSNLAKTAVNASLLSRSLHVDERNVNAVATATPPPPQILLFGDSITQGAFELQARLSMHYTRRLDVLNRGFGGYNSAAGLVLLSSFFPAIAPSRTNARVAVLIVAFGANDSCSPGEPQHCSVHDFKENLRSVASYKGVELHNTRVVLSTPPPVEEYRLPHDGRGRAERVAKYAEAVREVGRELRLPVIDLWAALLKDTGYNLAACGENESVVPGSMELTPSMELGRFLRDGLHLNADGYEIWTKETLRILNEEVQPCNFDEPEWYPEWVHFHPPTEPAFRVTAN
ncbi:hypothetical protein LTS08_008731 [Lithohypha guttulata]|nr:hypothetical protein LTS08_008731 [Lithohypha guttulata]